MRTAVSLVRSAASAVRLRRPRCGGRGWPRWAWIVGKNVRACLEAGGATVKEIVFTVQLCHAACGIEVIAAYHEAVAETVAGFDGFVAKYMGDGVLVYFGYPRAHEGDVERAVRAGLGLIDVVGRLDVRSLTLQARVGIATGLVVVGDLIGEGSAREQSVVGETPNLAARLQAIAEPGAVVIAEATRRLVGDLFEYRDL